MELNTAFMAETLGKILAGVPATLKITVVTLLIAGPLAFLFAIARTEKKKMADKIIAAYVSFIRGTPVVLQILFLYSLLPSLLNHLVKNVWHLDYNVFQWNPIIYAYTVFIINNLAVLTEMFRSALSTVHQGQLEAGLSIGMSKTQTYLRVIIPQAMVAALPNLCNTTVNLLKSTSLAYMMGVKEITSIARTEAAFGYNYIEAYLDILFVYLILCSVVQVLFKGVEKKLAKYKKLVAV